MAVSRIDFRGADSLVGDAQSAPTRPNQAPERTAARRAFTFQMIETLSIKATLALGAAA